MKRNISYIMRFCFTFFVVMVTLFCCNAQNNDITLLRKINRQRSPSGDRVMIVFTNSVYPVSGAFPVTELIIGYSQHDKKMIMNGWQTAGALGVNGILTFGLKYAVNRKRPYITYQDIDPYQHDTDPSFPSGHTSFSFCTAASVSICYPKWYVIAPSYLWASTVGYSRMYLGMHYPTDILASAITGTVSSWLAYKGNKWLQQRNRPIAEHK